MCVCFFFQAEDGIRDLVRSRGLGDVYKRQDEKQGQIKRLRDFQMRNADQSPAMLAKLKQTVIELSLIHI